MLKGSARIRHLTASAAVCAAVLLTVFTPKAAQAWWRPGWGWHGGVAIALPPVVVGGPVYPVVPYPYGSYPTVYAYPQPQWRWVPDYRAANGVIVAGHWER